MRNRILSSLIVGATLVSGLVFMGPSEAVLADQSIRPKVVTTTDYGSGIWGGPTSTYVQDAGWTNPNLKVGMVGDSITYRCQSQLRSAFATLGVTFALRGWAGADTDNQVTWLNSITYMPDLLIGELGTNNVFGPFGMPGAIARFKAAAGSGTEMAWVDTYVARPATLSHDLRNSGQVNNAIYGTIPTDHVVSWVAALTATVGRGVSLGNYIDPDGVHPNAAGCALLAKTVADAVAPLL